MPDLKKYEYWSSTDGSLYQGDALTVLKSMPEQSVNCCVTSPPYWGLRDYGESGQYGLEEIPEQYVENMVLVFREVRRVLRDDGSLFLNIGDSYNGSGGAGGDYNEGGLKEGQPKYGPKKSPSLKPKDLVGIPWMVAFALRSDSWYLRQDIIWHKPNPMPESVTDRCTKAHEYIFLLAKSQRYFYDADAVRVVGSGSHSWGLKHNENDPYNKQYGGREKVNDNPKGANKRSVWTIPTHPFPQAHFATFPPALIEPCILAGCPKGGTVLDPFIGSGTTFMVAYKHNRKCIGIDLSKTYLDEITIPRIEKERQQLKMF